jgi:hypothetical protein
LDSLQAYFTTLYLAVLLAMRLVAKRRGHALFVSYFRSIGIGLVLRAALSGFALAGIYLLVIAGLFWASILHLHQTIAGVPTVSHGLGRLAISALVYLMLARYRGDIFPRAPAG